MKQFFTPGFRDTLEIVRHLGWLQLFPEAVLYIPAHFYVGTQFLVLIKQGHIQVPFTRGWDGIEFLQNGLLDLRF